jgi:hypothetical protein
MKKSTKWDAFSLGEWHSSAQGRLFLGGMATLWSKKAALAHNNKSLSLAQIVSVHWCPDNDVQICIWIWKRA